MNSYDAQPSTIHSLADARELAATLRERMRYDVKGRDWVIELILVALFGDGHVLLEDFPGSGKTTLAKALGHSLQEESEGIPSFRRIQFTPDMLPSDITGVMVFDPEGSSFEFRRGPIFSYVVLADEINRTTPKVQSAMLEAMAEKQVTVDNISRPLDELFFVIATQNPQDSVGTYPLPLAQLDRFLFKIPMKHIEREAELEVLSSWGLPHTPCQLEQVKRGDVVAARALIRNSVYIAPAVREALVDIAGEIRDDRRCTQGLSTRALVQAIPALQTLAMLHGRDYVLASDLQELAHPLFHHRVALTPGVRDAGPVIQDALRRPMEKLARLSLKA